MDPDSFLKLLAALFFVLLNGFFVAAEFSIVKVRYSQIQIKAAEGSVAAKQAERILKNLDAYLSTRFYWRKHNAPHIRRSVSKFEYSYCP